MEKKQLRRLPPCPIYDTAGMESWLEDMAKDGWLLEEENAFLGYYIFQRTAPQTVHFRLEVVVNPQSIWDGDPKTPQPEALALHEEFGWHFVLRHGEFFIYQSKEPTPRELHTEPEIQAMTLKMLSRRLWKNFGASFLIFLFNVIFVFAYPISIALVLGTPFTLVLCILMIMAFARHLGSMYHIHRLRRALRSPNQRMDKKNWREGQKRYQAREILSLCLSLLFLLHVFTLRFTDPRKALLENLTDNPPFVTLEDLIPEADSVSLDKIDNGSWKRWRDPLFPEVWDFLDGGQATYPDGTVTGGLLDIQYCEARTPWLAQTTAKEFTRFYGKQARIWGSTVEVQPLPELGLDYAVGMYNQFGLIRVVLAEGNRMVCCRFSMDDEREGFTIEHWTELMVQRLKEG